MSRQLALSSAMSVLLMAAFVLFSDSSEHVPLGADNRFDLRVTAPALPSFSLPGMPGLR